MDGLGPGMLQPVSSPTWPALRWAGPRYASTRLGPARWTSLNGCYLPLQDPIVAAMISTFWWWQRLRAISTSVWYHLLGYVTKNSIITQRDQSHNKDIEIYVVRPLCLHPQKKESRPFILSFLTLAFLFSLLLDWITITSIYRPALFNFQASPNPNPIRVRKAIQI